MSIDAAAGASRTTSPGNRQRGGPGDHVVHHVDTRAEVTSTVSDEPTSTTGTSGACRASASAIRIRSAPMRTTPRSRSRTEVTSSSSCASRRALEQAAGDPHDVVERPQRRRRRVRVGGLGVVDEPDAVDRRDLGDAVRVGTEGPQPVPDRQRPHAVCASERGSGQRVRDVVGRDARRVALEVAQRPELGRRVLPRSRRRRGRPARRRRGPSIEIAGTPSVNPIARQPSTTSASMTSCSVSGSATL